MWIVYCTTYTVHCWYIFLICEILVGIAYQFYPEESYYYLFFLLLCHHKTLGTIRRVVNKWQWLTAWLTFFSHWLVSCVLLIFSSTMVMRLTCRFWALNIWESLSQSCVCSAVFCPFQIDGFGFVFVYLKDAYFHFPMMFFFFAVHQHQISLESYCISVSWVKPTSSRFHLLGCPLLLTFSQDMCTHLCLYNLLTRTWHGVSHNSLLWGWLIF